LIEAHRAYEMGLVSAVVPQEQLLDNAFEYAVRITKNAPLAVQATKRSVLEGPYVRSAVICIPTVPWHAPLKISLFMVPDSDPSAWGV
jgi:hypothetical protein